MPVKVVDRFALMRMAADDRDSADFGGRRNMHRGSRDATSDDAIIPRHQRVAIHVGSVKTEDMSVVLTQMWMQKIQKTTIS